MTQTGYEEDELLKMSPIDIKPDFDEASFRKWISPLIAGEKNGLAFETRHQRKDGHIIPVEIFLQYVEIRGEEPRFVAIVRDITERKMAEKKTQKLLQQNRDLTQRMFHVQEEERRHLARELHDEFGQWLTAIQLNAQNITDHVGKQSPDINSSIESITNSATHIHKGIRGMIHSLRPALLDELGLVDSLRELVAQWQAHNPNINCLLSLEGELDNLGETHNITIYRLVQEGLNNINKHAQASHVDIKLHRKHGDTANKDSIKLTIEDDGKGIDPSESTNGFGLVGMRERVLAVGGKFIVNNSCEKGAYLEAQLFINPI